jgi:hypothetical protein
VDIDGKTGYSNIIKIARGMGTQVNVYPNPVSGRSFSLFASGLGNGRYVLKVFNGTGQLVAERQLITGSGSINVQVDLPRTLPSGYYTLNLMVAGSVVNHQAILLE